MGYLLIKAVLSGLIIAIGSEVARRAPGFGGQLADVPSDSLAAGACWNVDRTIFMAGVRTWF